MTGEDLLVVLQKLTPEQRKLPLEVTFDSTVGGGDVGGIEVFNGDKYNEPCIEVNP